MKKSIVFVLTLILVLGTLTSVAYARDIERVDGAVYSTGWSTTPYMYKYNARDYLE